MRGFGPVRKGGVSLKPMTVFVGPANSGKSYAATLIHSVLNALSGDARTLQGGPGHGGRDEHGGDASEPGRRVPHANPNPGRLDLAASLPAREAGDLVLSELSKNLAPDLRSLVRRGSKSFSLDIGSGIAKLRITSDGTAATASSACPGQAGDPARGRGARAQNSGSGGLPARMTAMANPVHPQPATQPRRALAAGCTGERAGPSFYLPSSRSGILHGHKAISAGMARSSPSAGLHAMQGLHGVAADFTRVLLALPAQKARFADLAAEMEEELAGERISVAYGPEKTVIDIKYDGTPMRSASSSASELAPARPVPETRP